MNPFRALLLSVALTANVYAAAQTMNCETVANYPASIQRKVFEVCRHVNLSDDQQLQIAALALKEDSLFVDLVRADGGLLTNKSRNKLDKVKSSGLAKIMSPDQLKQYYRGVYDAEALAEADRIANFFRSHYNLTDQNWKFIRIAMYKIGLDSRMIKKVYASEPKKAQKMIEKLRKEQLQTIVDKGGIEINPETMELRQLVPFDPNALHR